MRTNDARAAIYAGVFALAIGIISILARPLYAQSLAGTSWQLVQFQSSEGATRTPDDKTKYTVTFGADNRVSVRFDCNRGTGTWSSPGSNQLRFGAMAMTEAACLTLGSLHDRIAKDWAYVRSYVLKDGHLFMSLMADGGIYEFEPMSERQAATASQSAHVKGTVSYVQRIALTESAVVEIKLFDISRADTPAATIAEQIIRPAGRQVPIDFDVSYDPSRIDPRGRYAIQARIFEGNIVRFVSADAYLVITGGNPTSIKVIVRPIGN